jgi:DinB superfamily
MNRQMERASGHRTIGGAMNMNKWMILASLVLAAGLAAGAARGQAGSQKAPPKSAPSPSQAVLESWNDIGRKLIAMAEDLPESKYDYKPHPDSRTFVANLLHASASMYYFTDTAQGKKARYGDDPRRDDLKTKAQVVAFVKKSVQDGADLIKAKGDQGMNEVVAAGSQMTRLYDLAYGLIEHSGEHYGQLVVYYRINGMVPPESRPKK